MRFELFSLNWYKFYPHPPQFANWGTFPQGKAFGVRPSLKLFDKSEFEKPFPGGMAFDQQQGVQQQFQM